MELEPQMNMPSRLRSGLALFTLAAIAAACPLAHAALRITLRNGSEFDCLRQEPAGDRVRLYLIPTAATHSGDLSYVEIPAASILRVDSIPDPPPPPPAAPPSLIHQHT